MKALPIAICVGLLSACVSAAPSLSGGRSTPAGKADSFTGASARIPFGKLRPVSQADTAQQAWLALTQTGAVTYAQQLRVGITPQMDLELLASGGSWRLQYRVALPLKQGGVAGTSVQLLFGLAPHFAYVDDDIGNAFRYGGEIPIVLAWDFSSVYEIWLGGRFAAEGIGASLESTSSYPQQDIDAFVWRAGAVLGFALGFRNTHALLELSVFYEHFRATIDGDRHSGAGLALVPAFGVRQRF